MHFLTNQGFPASIFSIRESIFEMLKKAKVYMRNNGKTEKEFNAIQKHVLHIASKYEIKAAHEASLLPGVFETLKILKDRNFKLAIFTINSKKSSDYILDNHRLKHFFDTIITREAVSIVKPDPSHLAAALEALDVNYDEAVVVGDSIVDMRSANALNTMAVGIAKDSNNAKKLTHAGATHTIESISELPGLIKKINQK